MPSGGARFGPKNGRWNGGQYVATGGYRFIQKPDHPNADHRGYVMEHVLVMSGILGRPIAKNEVVHHKNENRTDNRPENLEVMLRSKHHSLHHRGVPKRGAAMLAKDMPRACAGCGKEYPRRRPKSKYCTLDCYHRHSKQTSL